MTHMVRRVSMTATAVLLVSLLAGCAGLLSLLLTGLAVGSMYAQVRDFLGLDATRYAVVLDGYDMGLHPSPDGTLDLRGLPAGTHLLSITSDDDRIGFHKVVTIVPNSSLNLGQISLHIGAVIAGRVERRYGG